MDGTAAVVAVTVALIGTLGLVIPAWLNSRKINKKVDAVADTIGPKNGQSYGEYIIRLYERQGEVLAELSDLKDAVSDIAGAQAATMVRVRRIERGCPLMHAVADD